MDETTIQGMIDEVTALEIGRLKDLEIGSEEYDKATRGIERLRALSLKDTEMDISYDQQEKNLSNKERELDQRDEELKQRDIELAQRDRELDIREKDLAEDKKERQKDRYKDLALGAGSVLIPAGLYSFWMKKGFKFEEKGMFTSTTFRGITSGMSSFVRGFFR